jgi:uncharacterized protein
MTKEAKAELEVLVSVIKNSLNVEEIYLFGSFAYGEPNKDSDFDIYVVIPDDSIRPIEATHKIRANILPYQKRPIDLLVGRRSSFSKRKLSYSLVEHEVSSKGLKIYG